MNLIASYRNKGFESVADGVMAFFDLRTDLHRNGIAFSTGSNNDDEPAKISTDISLVSIDRNDPEAFALSYNRSQCWTAKIPSRTPTL